MNLKTTKKSINPIFYVYGIILFFISSFTSYSQIELKTYTGFAYNNPTSPGFSPDRTIDLCGDSTLHFKAIYPLGAPGAYKINQTNDVKWIKYNISGDAIGTEIRFATLTQPNIGDKNGDTLTLLPPPTSPISFYLKVILPHLVNIDAIPDYYYWLKINYIAIPSPPIVTVTPQPFPLNSPATLQASSVPGMSFIWYNTNLTEQSRSNPFITGPLKLDTVFYTRSAAISGGLTCLSNFVPVPISVAGLLYIPNAFTPNNDGKNDLFMVYGNEIKEMKLSIYNSWGALIFQSSDQAVGWGGKVGGVEQPRGVYTYVLTATLRKTNEKITRKGSVLLIR